MRLVLKPMDDSVGMTKKARQEYIKTAPNLFEVKDTTFILTEKARLFNNQKCSKCYESTMEAMLRLENGQPVCLDCFNDYSRIF